MRAAPRSVAAVSWTHLPRLRAGVVERTRAVARVVSAFGGSRSVTIGGLGVVRVRAESVSLAGGPPGSPADWVCLDAEAAGNPARVLVDTTLALGLVSALLGSPRPVVARPLGRAERGILAAIAAVVAEGLGSLPALRFHLAAPSGVLGADRVSLALSVRTPAASGRVWIEWPAAALPPEASAPSGGCGAEGLSDLVTTAVVELARTSLARGFWAGASAGDAVVFDGTACVDAGAPSVVGLRVGAFFAPAIFQTDGTIQLTGAFRPVMEGTQGMNTEDQQLATGNVTEVLAAAPVEIVAEIARVTLRGDEVLGLTTGSVLSLGRRVGDTVDLRVGGRPWARGELVAIDGELGVRLTALAR